MVLGWKRPGRVGRRRIQPQCGLPFAAALFTSKSSREATRFLSFVRSNTFFPSPRKLHRIAAQFAYGVPSPALAAASGSAVCHFLPQAAVRFATCCRAFHIEIESRSGSISFFVRSVTLFPSLRKLHRLAAQFALFLQFFRFDTLFSNKKVSHFGLTFNLRSSFRIFRRPTMRE